MNTREVMHQQSVYVDPNTWYDIVQIIDDARWEVVVTRHTPNAVTLYWARNLTQAQAAAAAAGAHAALASNHGRRYPTWKTHQHTPEENAAWWEAFEDLNALSTG
jgi:hypothetical protein